MCYVTAKKCAQTKSERRIRRAVSKNYISCKTLPEKIPGCNRGVTACRYTKHIKRRKPTERRSVILREMLSFVPYGSRTSVIRIVSYDDRSPRGWLINPMLEGKRYFANLTQLLFLIEDLHEELRLPRSSMEMRNFKNESERAVRLLQQPPDDTDGKPIATFKLEILFRQNASWQGRLIWIETSSESSFRSTLELINLIDSALQNAPDSKGDTK